jgi:hypothetical protein
MRVFARCGTKVQLRGLQPAATIGANLSYAKSENMMHKRALVTGFLCALISAVFVLPAIAAEDTKQTAGKDMKDTKPSATLDIASDQMRLIFGGTAGKGVLHFNGKDYPFTYKSASAGVGAKAVKEMSATGNVYFLNQIEDFPGKYTAVTRTALAGTSKVTATYKNDKGVTIDLKGEIEGVGLGLGAGIATVELVKQ